MPDINELDPSQFTLKRIKDKDTGEVYLSTGTKWIKLEQGPTVGQQMLRGGLSGLSAMAPMLIPGAGPAAALLRRGAESILPMAMETGLQQTGLAPKSGMDIGMAGLVSPGVRTTLGAPSVIKSGARGAAAIAAPQNLRDMAEDMARIKARELPQRGLFGRVAKGQSSSELFEKVATQSPLPVPPIVMAVRGGMRTELKKSNPATRAIGFLSNLEKKLTDPARVGTEISYADIAGELQDMRAEAAGLMAKKTGKRAAKTLFDVRAKILNEMDKVSPVIKKANEAFRREESIKTLSEALRRTNAANSVRRLFETDPLVRGAFSETARNEIEKIASSISRIGTGVTLGAGNRILMALAEPVAEALQGPTGRALLQVALRNPRDPMLIDRIVAIAAVEAGRSGTNTLRFGSEPPPSPR